jgi:anti-sigma B factor antagonist
MKITTTQNEGVASIAIVGDLRIATVADAKPELVAALVACDTIQIDLSDVGQIDTAGIQLLLMVRAGARAKGKGFALVGQTDSFRAALDRIGIPIAGIEQPAMGPDDGIVVGDRA